MAEPATDELIAEIEAGLEGVTPGPWEEGIWGHAAALIARIREQDAARERPGGYGTDR